MVNRRKRGRIGLSTCNLCDAQFNNESEKGMHKISSLHMFMVGIKRAQQAYMGSARTLTEQIEETGKREALIGLEYIYEYAENSRGVRMYECKLCEAAFRPGLIFFHIVGVQHRVLYLAQHHPFMGIEPGFDVQQQGQYRKLASHALAIEQTHGRRKINVVNEVYVSQPNVNEVSEADTDGEEGFQKQSKDYSNKPKSTKAKQRSKAEARKDLARMEARFRRLHNNVPRLMLQADNDDFDARALFCASNPESHHNSQGDAFDQQATLQGMTSKYATGGNTQMLADTGVRSISQPGIVPAAAGVLPVSPVRPVIGGRGRTSRDAFLDTDFRRRVFDRGGASALRGGASALRGRGGKRKDFATLGGAKGQKKKKRPARVRARKPQPTFSLRKPQPAFPLRKPQPTLRLPKPQPKFDRSIGGDTDVRSVLPSGGISFRELRAAHEGHLTGGSSSAHLPFEKEKEKEKEKREKEKEKKKKEKRKKKKETDSDMELCSTESSDCDPNEFWCNDELFDFLQSYYIGDDQGVRFILEAIKMMSEALVRHKSRKEDLQKRILEEKQRLEDEKQKFLELKKQKEDKITANALRAKKVVDVSLLAKVTGGPPSSTTPETPQAQAEKQPPKEAGSQPASAPAVQKTDPTPQAKTASQPPPMTSFQKAIVSGIAPVAPPAGQKPQAKKPQNPPQLTLSQKAFVAGIGPLLRQLFVNAQGPPTTSNQNEPVTGSGFNNQYPSKERRPLMGQGAGSYSAPKSVNQPQQMLGSWNPLMPGAAPAGPQPGQRPQDAENSTRKRPSRFDSGGSVGGAGVGLGPGSNTQFNQNLQNPGSRFDPHSSNQQTPFPGQGAVRYSAPRNLNQPQQQGVPRPQGPANRFNQNPGSHFDSRAPVDGAGLGSGPANRFNQNPGSHFDTRAPVDGAGLGSGSGTQFNQNPGMSSPRFENPNFPKNKYKIDRRISGPETHFNQNPQNPASGFDNPNLSKKPQPLMGISLGNYPGPSGRFNPNTQFSESWSDDGGAVENSKPLLGADPEANYQQTQWNSGAQSGNRGFYNEPQQPTGAGRYEEQYNQNQWQPQTNSRGTYGSATDRPLGTRGPQSTASADFSSNSNQGTWPNQNPPKPGLYPKSILKNRTGNPP